MWGNLYLAIYVPTRVTIRHTFGVGRDCWFAAATTTTTTTILLDSLGLDIASRYCGGLNDSDRIEGLRSERRTESARIATAREREREKKRKREATIQR